MIDKNKVVKISDLLASDDSYIKNAGLLIKTFSSDPDKEEAKKNLENYLGSLTIESNELLEKGNAAMENHMVDEKAILYIRNVFLHVESTKGLGTLSVPPISVEDFFIDCEGPYASSVVLMVKTFTSDMDENKEFLNDYMNGLKESSAKYKSSADEMFKKVEANLLINMCITRELLNLKIDEGNVPLK